MESVKMCNECRRVLPLERFSPDAAYKGGYKTICKDCVNDYGRRYRERQKEKLRDYITLQELMKAEKTLGGYKIFIQNHVKKGERKYNIVDTAGEVFKTNDKNEFFNYLRGII
jgi:hypothetical protein